MKISIIIPTFNRVKLLERTLLSIANQRTEEIFEVIVVDNGSTDATKSLCQKYLERIPNLIYAFDAEPGSLTGRHRGIEISTGDVLCFLDDDIKLNINYIQNLAQYFDQDINIQIATGPSFAEYEIISPDWIIHLWEEVPEGKYCSWLSLLDFGIESKIVNPNYVWSQNFCIRKNTIIKLGGFHPDYVPDALKRFQGNGETGLTIKALEQNIMAFYFNGLSVSHYVTKERLTFEYFKKRAFFQGGCESFTNMRRDHLNNPKRIKSLPNLIKAYGWAYVSKIKRSIKIMQQPPQPFIIKKFIKELKNCEKAGYQSHQDAFKNDENVRNWVLRENYWDYKLPV